MSERRRLTAEGGEQLPELLLHHARTDGPTEQARARALSRIVAAGAVGSGMGVLAASLANKGASASFGKASTLMVAQWIVIGATTATAVLGASETVERLTMTSSADRRPSSMTQARPPPGRDDRAIPTPLLAAPSATDPMATDELPGSVEPIPALGSKQHRLTPQPEIPGARPGTRRELSDAPSAAAAAAAATAEPALEVASPQLSRELELLEKARLHLARKSAWAALDALETYRATFPRGTMTTEAAVLQIEALAAVGRRYEATVQSRAFLTHHAQNPLAERVRVILAKLESSPSLP
jgi:hypothetical protein